MPLNLTIYVDVLFLLNMIVDYIVLSSSALISGRETVKRRMLLGAAVGALYSVIIFFPQLQLLNIIIFKIIASAVIILISFKYINIYSYFKIFVTYYVINAVYGGGMYAFYHFTSLGSRMNSSNGVYYIDLPLWAVILMAFIFYYIIKIFSKISGGRAAKRQIRRLNIYFSGTHVTVNALFDTGNTLYDPISLMPVMLIEADVLRGKLSESLLRQVRENSTDELPLLHELHPELKLRVVPFKDITGSKSFVYAFKPEKITDIDKNTDIERMLVGIIGTQLSAEGAFNALLHSKV